MADIFISYKSERKPYASRLAHIFQNYGFTVWFDYGLEAGESFVDRINAEIDAAQLVIPLWCSMSVDSEWVHKEANRALEQDKLYPVKLQDLAPPQAFDDLHSHDLTGWDGNAIFPRLDSFVEAVCNKLGRTFSLDANTRENLASLPIIGRLPVIRKVSASQVPITGAASINLDILDDPEDVVERWLTLDQKNVQELKEFIQEVSEGACRRAAIAILESLVDRDWVNATRSVEALHAYLQRHPDGPNAENARKWLKHHRLAMLRIQAVLKKQGCFHGRLNGEISAGLRNALVRFGIHSGLEIPEVNEPEAGIFLDFAQRAEQWLPGDLLEAEEMYSVGHGQGNVCSACFSPDGAYLLTGCEDGSAKLWDADTGSLVRIFGVDTDALSAVAISPDGRLLATGGQDGFARILRKETGELHQSLDTSGHIVFSVEFSPDGKYLATGSSDGIVRLWDVETGTSLRSLDGQSGSVLCIAFGPDGLTLAAGCSNKAALIWRVDSGVLLHNLMVEGRRVECIAFSPDADFVVTGSDRNHVQVWRAVSGSLHHALDRFESVVNGVQFSPNGYYLAVGAGREAYIQNVRTGAIILRKTGHTSRVRSISFSPDGKCVATASDDGTARVFALSFDQPN